MGRSARSMRKTKPSSVTSPISACNRLARRAKYSCALDPDAGVALVAVQVDQVDVGRHVEFARAQLAHADDPEIDALTRLVERRARAARPHRAAPAPGRAPAPLRPARSSSKSLPAAARPARHRARPAFRPPHGARLAKPRPTSCLAEAGDRSAVRSWSRREPRPQARRSRSRSAAARVARNGCSQLSRPSRGAMQMDSRRFGVCTSNPGVCARLRSRGS